LSRVELVEVDIASLPSPTPLSLLLFTFSLSTTDREQTSYNDGFSPSSSPTVRLSLSPSRSSSLTPLPSSLISSSLLNSPSTRSETLSALSEASQLSSLSPILPFLTLDTLLALRGDPALSLEELVGAKDFYALLDAQRDWVVSPSCPVSARDEYLVRVFPSSSSGEEEKGAWEGVKEGMEAFANSPEAQKEVERGMVLKAEEGKVKGGSKGVCGSLKEFEEGLEEMSGGLFKNRTFAFP
jgi:hypothetical protein